MLQPQQLILFKTKIDEAFIDQHMLNKCENFNNTHHDHTKITYEEISVLKNEISVLESSYSRGIMNIDIGDIKLVLSEYVLNSSIVKYTYIQDSNEQNAYYYLNLEDGDTLQGYLSALSKDDIHYLTNSFFKISEDQSSEQLYMTFLNFMKIVYFISGFSVDSKLTSNYDYKGLINYTMNKGATFSPGTGKPMDFIWLSTRVSLLALGYGDTEFNDTALSQLAASEANMIGRSLIFDIIPDDLNPDHQRFPFSMTLEKISDTTMQISFSISIVQTKKYKTTVTTDKPYVMDFLTQLNYAMNSGKPDFFNYFTKRFDGVSNEGEIQSIAIDMIDKQDNLKPIWDEAFQNIEVIS